jgi:hypothetical protein
MMTDQQDIMRNSFQRPAAEKTEKDKAATKTRAEKAAAAKAGSPAAAATDVTITLQQHNDVSCWYWTNGLHCPNKFKDASGQCKYHHLHGTCGMPLSNGEFCKGKHRASEHP